MLVAPNDQEKATKERLVISLDLIETRGTI